MDSVYSAASSAARAVFGDTTDNNSRQNPVQQRPGESTATAGDRTTDTNPFRGTTGNDGNPFRHAAADTAASYPPSGAVLGGSGTRHTASSGGPTADHRINLNKPVANIYESRPDKPYDPDYSATRGASSFAATHPSDRPTTTTTSMLEKPSIGDLNKDGVRHETSDIERPLQFSAHSEERPTISDTRVPGAFPAQTFEAERSLRSNLHEDTLHSTHEHPGAMFPGAHEHTATAIKPTGMVPGEYRASDTLSGSHDRAREHTIKPTGMVPGEHRASDTLSGSHDRAHEHAIKPTGMVPGEHRASDTLPDSRDRAHEHTATAIKPTGMIPGEHRASDTLPRSHDRAHEHAIKPTGMVPGEHRASDTFPDSRDRAHEHTMKPTGMAPGEYRASDTLPRSHDRAHEHTIKPTSMVPGEHRASDTLSGSHDRAHEHTIKPTGMVPGEHRASDTLPDSRDRTHEHQQGSGTQPHTTSTGVSSAFPSTTGQHHTSNISDSRDRTHQSGTDLEGDRDRTHDLHHKAGSVSHPHTDQSRLHDKPGSSTMGEDHVSGLSDKPSSSTDTYKPTGLGAHKSTTAPPKPTPAGPGGIVLPVQEKSTESGTGEKYEKSTGVAAEGGDFDASRPGAGREADRLLDEQGVHHGAEKKTDVGVDTDKGVHKKAAVGTEQAGTEHKGLGEKIKEKLHLGHH